jgi:putative Holliday junction resolvase
MSSILALDVGEKRIGVAIANSIARLARPLTTLPHDDNIFATLEKLIADESVSVVVVGLPRNLSGEDTDQTAYVRQFTEKLRHDMIRFQDEALTSKKAEMELRQRGKPYAKGDIDALAATYILEDYLQQHGVES